MTLRKLLFVCSVLACLLGLPAAALAQSTIAGTVKDTSDAVLPGVTVTISSPAMIEGTKEATTDGSGQYRFVDLRPGMYAIKFTLTGFTTVERTAYQLLTEFNARIDAQMKVGAMEETITVTGAAPIVDVSTASKVAVLDRDAIDNIPTGKTIQGLGQLILGVSLNAPDVGGSAGAMQTYMSMRGGSVSAANNTVMVDGMVINGLMLDGAVQTYTNDANFQEMTYQTAGINAEGSGGGVRLNLVPKEGGNRFSGSASALYRPGQLQGDNYSDRFKTWGLPTDKNGDPNINRVERISDLNFAEGGPISKDKLWFFFSGRDFQPINTVPNTFLDDGSQGVDDNYIRNANVRLTYQASPRHKFSAFYERVFKWRGHDMSALEDPETIGVVWTSPNYSTASAKYTGTLSSKLLVEGGYSQNVEYYRNLFQEVDAPQNRATYGVLCCGDGVEKEAGTEAWFTQVAHAGNAGVGGAGVAPGGTVGQFPASMVYQGSASYVTGQHHAKLGFTLRTGKFDHSGDNNGHLSQTYPSFVRDENFNVNFPTSRLSNADFNAMFGPGTTTNYTTRPCNPSGGTSGTATLCRVSIRNSPRFYGETLNNDLGIYLQDSFTMKRLTVNAGIRYETLKSQVDVTTSSAGRFVPDRTTVERKDIPDWSDWAPRFQLVYDVFGNSKTAVKYSFNRYNESVTTSVAAGANPIALQTSTRFWTDLNGDDIAQGARTWNADGTAYTDCTYMQAGCEINLTGVTGNNALQPDFGLVTSAGTFTQFPRRYRMEHGFELQHALLPRVSLNGTFYHGDNHNIVKTINTGQTDDGTLGTQYRQVQLFNPIDGTPYLYYSSLVTFAGTNNVTYVEPERKSKYDSYTAEVQMRPYAGAQMSGGIELTRTLSKDCSTSYVKADGTKAMVSPNSLRFCDQENMVQYAGGPVVGKPFNKNFKLSGAFPIVFGLNLGVSYQNIDSGRLSPTYQYGANFRYPAGTQTMLGASTPVPACPTAYGCVPGGVAWVAGLGNEAGSTGNQFTDNAIAEERIVQLDLKVSKNLRFGRLSVQPTFEAFNMMNIDQVRSRLSSEYGASTGRYLQPNNMLQGRILGFGANVKW